MAKPRPEVGNTLAMIAVTLIVMLAFLLFLALYVSMLRSSSEHRSAIDSAAIAAAKDVSRIVINTPEFGYVALTTEAPTGASTNAPDDWYQEVRSLNELMATARLDMIIAHELGDSFMNRLALADYNNVLRVKDDLHTEIIHAIASGGSARDAAGNLITPYLSAERIYLINQAKGSSYVAGSLRLSLGGVEGGIESAIVAPSPIAKAACLGKETGGRYRSEVNIPFLDTPFVFGSVSRRVALCDKDKFKEVVPGLPFQMPAVVMATATQQFQDQGKTWTVGFAACASAGSNEPERPAPGALTLSFPDGPLPEIVRPGDVWGWAALTKEKMVQYQATGGDFIVERPGASLVPWAGAAIPFSSSPPFASEVATLALYDWIRCGGSNVNIDSIVALQTLPFNVPAPITTAWIATDPEFPLKTQTIGNIPTGIMHIYTFNTDGTTRYVSQAIKPYPYTSVGENQLYSELENADGIHSDLNKSAKWKFSNIKYSIAAGTMKIGEVEGSDRFDMYVRDLARCLGSKSGGKHAGERLDGNQNISCGFGDIYSEISGTTSTGGAGPGAPTLISRQDDFASTNIPAPTYTVYSRGPAGGAPRPAYAKNGLSADIRFRRQVLVGDLKFYLGGYKTGYVGEMLEKSLP